MTLWILLMASSLMYFWTLLGYSLFMKCMSLGRKLPELVETVKDFDIVLVVHDPGEHLKTKLSELLSYQHTSLKSIWLLDDGSDENLEATLNGFDDERLRYVALERGGKSKALNHARDKVISDIAVLMDVRQSINEEDCLKMVRRLSSEGFGAVSGQLTLQGGDDSYWKFERQLRYAEGLFASTMGLTGAGAAIKKEFWQKIPDNTLADDMALGLSVLAQGQGVCIDPEVKIVEPLVPNMQIEWPRKIRTLSANWQIFLSPSKYQWPWSPFKLLMLVSHKMMRLLFPVMFVIIAVNAVLLKETWLNTLLCVMALVSALSFILPFKPFTTLKQLIYLHAAVLVSFFSWKNLSRKGRW